MKIPEVFVSEKNLDDKVNDLLKEQHIKPTGLAGYTGLEIIQKKAEQIAINLGKKKSEGYIFKDKGTKLMIEYTPGSPLPKIPFGPPVLLDLTIIYLKKGLFKREILFEYIKREHFNKEGVKDEGVLYARGEWDRDLEELYIKSQQK